MFVMEKLIDFLNMVSRADFHQLQMGLQHNPLKIHYIERPYHFFPHIGMGNAHPLREPVFCFSVPNFISIHCSPQDKLALDRLSMKPMLSDFGVLISAGRSSSLSLHGLSRIELSSREVGCDQSQF